MIELRIRKISMPDNSYIKAIVLSNGNIIVDGEEYGIKSSCTIRISAEIKKKLGERALSFGLTFSQLCDAILSGYWNCEINVGTPPVSIIRFDNPKSKEKLLKKQKNQSADTDETDTEAVEKVILSEQELAELDNLEFDF